jgi:hypothetical protein
MPSQPKPESLDEIWQRLSAAMEAAGLAGKPQQVSFTHLIDGELKTITLSVEEVCTN